MLKLASNIALFLAGSLFLCILSTIQKLAIGAPLVLKGYAVPFAFGGVAAFAAGSWAIKLRKAKKDLEQANDELENRVRKRTAELEKALGEIKTLKGILPICSMCKKVRDKDGCWIRIEAYIARHSEAETSHGICPECAEKYYPDLGIYD